jgi:hypothetical protein
MTTRTEIIPIWTERDLALVDAHPRISRLFATWKSRHRPAGLPGYTSFASGDLDELRPGLWVVEVQREPFRLRYRTVGSRVVEALGRDVSGMWLDEAHPTGRPKYAERAMAVVRTGVPSWRRGPPLLWQHALYTKLENLILPLADDGATIDTLLMLTVFYRADGTAD